MRSLRGEVQSYFLVSQDRLLDVETFVVADAEGQYWLDYSVWINDEKLGRAEIPAPRLFPKNPLLAAAARNIAQAPAR